MHGKHAYNCSQRADAKAGRQAGRKQPGLLDPIPMLAVRPSSSPNYVYIVVSSLFYALMKRWGEKDERRLGLIFKRKRKYLQNKLCYVTVAISLYNQNICRKPEKCLMKLPVVVNLGSGFSLDLRLSIWPLGKTHFHQGHWIIYLKYIRRMFDLLLIPAS